MPQHLSGQQHPPPASLGDDEYIPFRSLPDSEPPTSRDLVQNPPHSHGSSFELDQNSGDFGFSGGSRRSSRPSSTSPGKRRGGRVQSASANGDLEVSKEILAKVLSTIKANLRGGSAQKFLKPYAPSGSGVISDANFQKLCRGPLKLSEGTLPVAKLAQLADVFRREDSRTTNTQQQQRQQITVEALAAAVDLGPTAFYRHALRTLERHRPPPPYDPYLELAEERAQLERSAVALAEELGVPNLPTNRADVTDAIVTLRQDNDSLRARRMAPRDDYIAAVDGAVPFVTLTTLPRYACRRHVASMAEVRTLVASAEPNGAGSGATSGNGSPVAVKTTAAQMEMMGASQKA